jgi:ABC-2 type transport system ATP-binding protein
MAHAITVDRLRKTYRDVVAVDEVSFEVEENEIFGIVGPKDPGRTRWSVRFRLPTSGRCACLPDPARAKARHRSAASPKSPLPERIKAWEALICLRSERRDWRVRDRLGIYDRRNAAFANLPRSASRIHCARADPASRSRVSG